eukprot:12485302-Heterocapsa_arctica.AAC.1
MEDRAVGVPYTRLAHPAMVPREEASGSSQGDPRHDEGGGAWTRQGREDAAVLDHGACELDDVAGGTWHGNRHDARVVTQQGATFTDVLAK